MNFNFFKINFKLTVTSANPTLISSSKVDDKKPEEEEEYDDGDEEGNIRQKV